MINRRASGRRPLAGLVTTLMIAGVALGGELRVNTTADNNQPDQSLSFREALLIARGDRQPFDHPVVGEPDEMAQVTGEFGAGIADTIVLAIGSETIVLADYLPPLDDSTDSIQAGSFATLNASALSGAQPVIDLADDSPHRIDGLRIFGAKGIALRVASAGNVVDAMVVESCSAGTEAVLMQGPAATGNTLSNMIVRGNAADGVAVREAAAGNTLTNLFVSQNGGNGIVVEGTGTSNNIIMRTAIGLGIPSENYPPEPNGGWGVVVRGGATDNRFGDPNSDPAFSYFSNNALGGMLVEGAGTQGNLLHSICFGWDASNPDWVGNGTGPGLQISGGAKDNAIGKQGVNSTLIFGGHTGPGILVSGPETTGNNIQRVYVGTDGFNEIPRPNASHGIHIQDGAGQFFLGGPEELSQIEINNTGGHALFFDGNNQFDPIDDVVVGVIHFGTKLDPNSTSPLPSFGGDGIRVIGNVDGLTLGGGEHFHHSNHVCGASDWGIFLFGPLVRNITLVGIHAGVFFDQSIPNGKGGIYIGNGANNIRVSDDTLSYASGNNGPGILIDAGGTLPSDILLESLRVGLSPFLLPLPNQGDGLFIEGPEQGTAAVLQDVQVGRVQETSPSVFSGNRDNGIHLKNVAGVEIMTGYFGLGPSGLEARPNGKNGILIDGCHDLAIGGTEGVVHASISGNTEAGIALTGQSYNINCHRNDIGLGTSGAAVPNGTYGIDITSGPPAGESLVIGGDLYLTADPFTGGNTISGNTLAGVRIHSPAGSDPIERVALHGNLIGTNSPGTEPRPNAIGILLDGEQVKDVTIGDRATASLGNMISGNTNEGIKITKATGWNIANNLIGTNRGGDTSIANHNGISLSETTDGHIGFAADPQGGNLISGNTEAGIRIGDQVYDVEISANRIGTNGPGTAALGNRDGILVDHHSPMGTRLIIGGTNTGIPTRAEKFGAGNLISGNTRNGVRLASLEGIAPITNVALEGNVIGLNRDGTAALPNAQAGVFIGGAGTSDILIGSRTDIQKGNILSGNATHGIEIAASASEITIQNNSIGTGYQLTEEFPNEEHGIKIHDGANRNHVESNWIRYNRQNGIHAAGATTNRNTFRSNFIHRNEREGIKLADGANDGIQAPKLSRLFKRGRSQSKVPGTTVPAGEVETFLDPPVNEKGYWGQGMNVGRLLTAGGDGKFEADHATIRGNGILTCTVTDAQGNTSEFSPFADWIHVQSTWTPSEQMLVEGKPTTFRIYLDSGTAVSTVKATGRITLGTQTAGPTPAEYGPRPYALFDRFEGNRRKADDTMNIQFPRPEFGTVQGELVITNPAGDIERGRFDLGEFNFQETNSFRFGIVEIRAPDHTGTVRAAEANAIIQALQYFATVYPVNPREWLSRTRFIPGIVLGDAPHTEPRQRQLNEKTEKARVRAEKAQNITLRYAGAFISHNTRFEPPGGTSTLFGYTYPDIPKVVALNDRYNLAAPPPPNLGTLCHEIGHTVPFKLGDTYQGGSFSTNNPLPGDATLYDHYGVLIQEEHRAWSHTSILQLTQFSSPGPAWSPPKTHSSIRDFHDFMSNARVGWADENMMRRLFWGLGGILTNPPRNTDGSIMARDVRETVDGTFLARGTISQDDSVQFLPVLRVDSTTERDTPTGATDPYRVELRDTQGQVLDAQDFHLTFEKEHLAADNVTEDSLAGHFDTDSVPFSIVLQDSPSAAELVFLKDGTELASLTPSPSEPIVTLLEPHGPMTLPSDQITVSWIATDIDGDALYIDVLYTPDDGETIIPVATELRDIASIVIPTGMLPGGATPRFIVAASDLWHETKAQSEPPLIAADRDPVGQISRPTDGSSAHVGEAIPLLASVFDPEDGILSGDTLQWYLDGAVQPFASDMEPQLVLEAEGPHTLQLIAKDSAGNTLTHAITLNAVPSPFDPVLVLQQTLGLLEPDPSVDRNGDGVVDIADWTQETSP